MQKHSKITALLAQLGLNDKEVGAYVSLLKMGRATASEIAQESGITRTHVYTIAEDLRKRGFLSMLNQKGVRSYEALNHAELLALVKRKSEELETLGKKIGEAVSDFESLKQHGKQATKVQFFSGREGVLNIYKYINGDLKKIKEPFEIVTIFSPERLEKTFSGFFEQKKYIDAPLMTKRDIINESEVFFKHLEQRQKEGLGQYFYKIWPREKSEFPADTLCWQNKIAFIELSEYPTGTIIENEAVAKTFKMWFEKMWQGL